MRHGLTSKVDRLSNSQRWRDYHYLSYFAKQVEYFHPDDVSDCYDPVAALWDCDPEFLSVEMEDLKGAKEISGGPVETAWRAR